MYTSNRGFISIRYLIALCIAMSILPIVVFVMMQSTNFYFDYSIVNDEMALLQLRRIMLLSYDVNNYGDSLSFLYKNKDYELELINNRLILSPGYQMFLDEVDDLYFDEDGNVLNIYYEKKGKRFIAPIYKTNGIYIDEFSDCLNEHDCDTLGDE